MLHRRIATPKVSQPYSCSQELYHTTGEETKIHSFYGKQKYTSAYSQGSAFAQTISPVCTMCLPRICKQWTTKCKLKSILSAFVKKDLNTEHKMLFMKSSPCCDHSSRPSKHRAKRAPREIVLFILAPICLTDKEFAKYSLQS